jgi:hypothetical protein
MLRFAFIALLLAAFTGTARADACDSLIETLQGRLAGADAPSTETLQRLLGAARAAKQAGNVKACEAAMSSPAPRMPGSSKHSCEKSPNTV